MNEQYLARGKRLDNVKWVTGYYAEPGCHHVILTGEIVAIDNELTWERYEIDPATLGRCTELRDKNGRLIFEGDIIIDGMRREGVVEWDKNEAAFFSVFVIPARIHKKTLFNANTMSPSLLTVLGNKWDNLELLEVCE